MAAIFGQISFLTPSELSKQCHQLHPEGATTQAKEDKVGGGIDGDASGHDASVQQSLDEVEALVVCHEFPDVYN